MNNLDYIKKEGGIGCLNIYILSRNNNRKVLKKLMTKKLIKWKLNELMHQCRLEILTITTPSIYIWEKSRVPEKNQKINSILYYYTSFIVDRGSWLYCRLQTVDQRVCGCNATYTAHNSRALASGPCFVFCCFLADPPRGQLYVEYSILDQLYKHIIMNIQFYGLRIENGTGLRGFSSLFVFINYIYIHYLSPVSSSIYIVKLMLNNYSANISISDPKIWEIPRAE